ncbi:MAG: hypothetical protein ACE5MB_10890, partial [Anaerolineae bacterium]
MTRRTLLVSLALALPLALILIFVVAMSTSAQQPTYLGSSVCRGCHPDKHTGWQETLHAKMIQGP